LGDDTALSRTLMPLPYFFIELSEFHDWAMVEFAALEGAGGKLVLFVLREVERVRTLKFIEGIMSVKSGLTAGTEPNIMAISISRLDHIMIWTLLAL
jgi:hypothetical protein